MSDGELPNSADASEDEREPETKSGGAPADPGLGAGEDYQGGDGEGPRRPAGGVGGEQPKAGHWGDDVADGGDSAFDEALQNIQEFRDEDLQSLPDDQPRPYDEDEELRTEMAAPPEVLSNQVQGLDELDEKANLALPSNKDLGIDISLLSSVLSPQEDVIEPDEEWMFDKLFVTVTSEMQAEIEARAQEDADTEEGIGQSLGSRA